MRFWCFVYSVPVTPQERSSAVNRHFHTIIYGHILDVNVKLGLNELFRADANCFRQQNHSVNGHIAKALVQLVIWSGCRRLLHSQVLCWCHVPQQIGWMLSPPLSSPGSPSSVFWSPCWRCRFFFAMFSATSGQTCSLQHCLRTVNHYTADLGEVWLKTCMSSWRCNPW